MRVLEWSIAVLVVCFAGFWAVNLHQTSTSTKDHNENSLPKIERSQGRDETSA